MIRLNFRKEGVKLKFRLSLHKHQMKEFSTNSSLQFVLMNNFYLWQNSFFGHIFFIGFLTLIQFDRSCIRSSFVAKLGSIPINTFFNYPVTFCWQSGQYRHKHQIKLLFHKLEFKILCLGATITYDKRDFI